MGIKKLLFALVVIIIGSVAFNLTAQAEDVEKVPLVEDIEKVVCGEDVEEVTLEEVVEEVTAEEVVTGGRVAPYYNINTNGGKWDGKYYILNNKIVSDAFFCDGIYTYYLQSNGTPMKNTLTYHPDGVHIIYFDDKGHELFDQFQYCKNVGYSCYFDTFGYAYFNQITFVNNKPYYLDSTGRMKAQEYFKFDNGVDYGYANADGSLMNNCFGLDNQGRAVFYHWNGMVARGLITDGTWYYDMDSTDGHFLGRFTSGSGVRQTPPSQQAMIDEVYRLCRETNPNCVISTEVWNSNQWDIGFWIGELQLSNTNLVAQQLYNVIIERGPINRIYIHCYEWTYVENLGWMCYFEIYWDDGSGVPFY